MWTRARSAASAISAGMASAVEDTTGTPQARREPVDVPLSEELELVRVLAVPSRGPALATSPGGGEAVRVDLDRVSVGPYELHEQLGKGGLGVVHRATDSRTGRPVALKLLAATEERSRQRLLLEARALARLRHRNVVALLEAGEERGRPWLALELVSGRSLEERLREGPLPPLEAARLVRALAAGLAHAHREGVLHRDLKPGNVLLPADGGEPRLADFGLAAVEAELDRSRLTKSGTLMGSPGWWSPEQAAGQASAVGPATDVYGLGALLYAALTGRPPIEGSSLMAILTATERTRPTPPGVDPELDALALRCLAKRPEERPPSVEAVARELSRWLARRSRPARGRLVLPLAVALVALGLGLGLGLASSRRPDAPPSSEAAPPTSVASPADPMAALVAAEVAAHLASAQVWFDEGKVAAAVADFERALALEPRSAAAHVGRARCRATVGDDQGALTDFARAVELDRTSIPARVMRGVTRARLGLPGGLEDCEAALALEPGSVQALTGRGVVRCLAGEPALAVADFDAVLARSPDDVEALVERGRCRGRLDQDQAALADLDRALGLRPFHFHALLERGVVSARIGDQEAALAHYERALALAPDHGGALLRRGVLRLERGDPRAALADFDHAVRVDPADTAALSNRGLALARLGQHEAALTDFDRVLALEPRNPETLENRAVERARGGDRAGAIADFDVLISVQPDDLAAVRNRGLCKLGTGDHRGALADFEAVLARAPRDAFTLVNRGDARAGLGDLAGAVADFEAALALLPPGSPQQDELRQHLAETRARLEVER